MILVKKLKFFHLLCLAKIHRENVCAYVLDIKEAFKDYKNNCVRKTQIHQFQKRTKLVFLQRGYSMFFVKNMKFCERFLFSKIHPEKVFCYVLVRKQACLDSINMDLKRRQNWYFCKGDSP